jgi:predicted nucleotidyltransferase
MPIDDPSERILVELLDAEIAFIVVGGLAAVLQGAPIVTFDLDIVHRRTPQNVDRLLALLLERGAYHRLDSAQRRLPPAREALLGQGHLNLAVGDAKVDVLCEIAPHDGYDELVADAEAVPFHGRTLRVLGLARLIQAKAAAARPKDRPALPILVATLEARTKTR